MISGEVNYNNGGNFVKLSRELNCFSDCAETTLLPEWFCFIIFSDCVFNFESHVVKHPCGGDGGSYGFSVTCFFRHLIVPLILIIVLAVSFHFSFIFVYTWRFN